MVVPVSRSRTKTVRAADTYFAPSEQAVDPMVASDGLSGDGGFVAFTGWTATRFEVYVERLR